MCFYKDRAGEACTSDRQPVNGGPVSRAQLTGGPSLPESATAHARPTYLSRRSEFTGVVYVYMWNHIRIRALPCPRACPPAAMAWYPNSEREPWLWTVCNCKCLCTMLWRTTRRICLGPGGNEDTSGSLSKCREIVNVPSCWWKSKVPQRGCWKGLSRSRVPVGCQTTVRKMLGSDSGKYKHGR